MDKHKLLRWAIIVIIVLLAFWCGMKVGEFRVLYGGYGYYGMWPGMMWGDYGYPGYNYPGYAPMMGGYYYYPYPTSSVAEPSAPPANATATAPYYYGPGWMMRGWYGQ